MKLFKSELNCDKAVLIFDRWLLAISLLGEETTNLIVVSKPDRLHLSSILSKTFGSVLKVAFSGLASFFLVVDT